MTQAHNPIDVIHQELMGQLHDIVRVCNAHDIPYNLMCGTLLGAVANTAIGVASDEAGSYLPVYGVSAAACAACAALSVLLSAWERKAGPAALEKAVVPEGENG